MWNNEINKDDEIRKLHQDIAQLVLERDSYFINPEPLKRKLHTYKGTAMILGQNELGDAIHQVETLLGANQVNAALNTLEEITVIQEAIKQKKATQTNKEVIISQNPIVRQPEKKSNLKNILHSYWLARWDKSFKLVWRSQPDKQINFQCDFFSLPEIYVEDDFVNELMQLIEHLIRNSVVHGIENSTNRVLKGKDKTGLIKITISVSNGLLNIEIYDDGKGFSKATYIQKIGNYHDSDEKDVTLFAGRGVGLSAVIEGIARLGGRIVLNSRPDEYARLLITVPYPEKLHDTFCFFETVSPKNCHVLPMQLIKNIRYVGKNIYELETEQGGIQVSQIHAIAETTLYRHAFSKRFFTLWNNTPFDYAPDKLPENHLTAVDVFIVDDEPLARINLVKFIKNLSPKANVREYKDGLEAWQALEEGLRPRLILCDWEMPNMTGEELLKQINEFKIITNFVMVSSRDVRDYRTAIMAKGALEFLGKPANPETLTKIIKELGI